MSYVEIPRSSVHRNNNEADYANYRLKSVIQSGPLIIALPAAFNFLMLFADWNIIQEQTTRIIILFIRVLYSLSLLLLLVRIKKIRRFSIFCRIITLFETACVVIFLYVFTQYPNPDFMIQTLGVITIIITVFLIPNTWKNMLAIVGVTEVSFLLLSKLTMPAAGTMNFRAGAVYITIDALLCAFFSWNRQKSQHMEFLARQELDRQSSTDHLTQAVTRFKLEEEADRWLHFCRRQGIPLSLIFVDVDNLKPINDKYGHLAGDKVLSEIVFRIRASLRNSDITARWGGDEFVLLLPDSDLAKTVEISESVRRSIENSPVLDGVTVTCSFGVVTMNGTSTFETMIHEADELMYRSKKLGRNRVEYSLMEAVSNSGRDDEGAAANQ
ncbi:MAG: GGDEF domain-containing protein [Eubacteriales bacterium]